jgi:hypothetical protein
LGHARRKWEQPAEPTTGVAILGDDPRLQIPAGQQPGRWEEGLNHGVTYQLKLYSANNLKLDLAAQLERGNHQSAKACLGVLDKLNAKDVEHSYSFCLPMEALHDIKELAVTPHGVVHQGTINEVGQLITKDCPRHSQSFANCLRGNTISN